MRTQETASFFFQFQRRVGSGSREAVGLVSYGADLAISEAARRTAAMILV